MSDFAQTGLITTLQRLNETHLEAVEAELGEMVAERPVALVLPCHARELECAALAHILDELAGARWLDEVVVSMNGLDAAGHARARSLFARLPQRMRVLWNDQAEPADGGGKGANVAAAFRLLAEEGRAGIVATQDCDVASFRRRDLARLCYAVARLEYRYAKAYYPRVTDRLYGRVTRLFVAPLLHACVRVAGHQPLLDFLLSFRYPLAGEVAMTREVAAALPVASGYALEIGQLCEVFRHLDPREVCQVDGGAGYDHRHQPAITALAAMAGEIAAELFRQLAAEGLPGTAEFRTAIASAYRREAEQSVRRSAALAKINGLPFDEAAERETVAAFAAVNVGGSS
jgi:glucosyl-3-phosphoglycerate synthase